MRNRLDSEKFKTFMQRIGELATSAGTIYVTGGATALLLGIREQTIDIDIKLDPEPAGVFNAIAELKEALNINVELASPDLFLPPLPEWKERSRFIASYGMVQFRHYDFYSQALAKIERGHNVDMLDARALLERGYIRSDELKRLAESIELELMRYPAIDPVSFYGKIRQFLEESGST